MEGENNTQNLLNNESEEIQEKELKKRQQDLEKRVEGYKGTLGITTKQLNRGLWYVRNRKYFIASFAIFFIIVGAISWFYTIYNYGLYYSQGIHEDRQQISELINTQIVSHDYILSLSPDRLLISPVDTFVSETGVYDFYATVDNPNSRYIAYIDYCFFAGEETIECSKAFIYPKEKKYLMSLTNDVEEGVRNVDFVIQDLSWKRINLHQFPNWQATYNNHINFDFENVNFTPARTSGLSEKLNLNILEFTVINQTPYNYWEVPLYILLYRSNVIVGINKYTVTELMSKERRDIIISWPGNLGVITEVDVIPEVDFLSNDAYIEYPGGSGIPK